MTKQQKPLPYNMPLPYIACGVDLVEYEAFSRIVGLGKERLLQRIYTQHEQIYCADDLHQLSARWAAKEAVAKALGTGFRNGVNPIDIEIEHAASGKPVLHLHRQAKVVAEQCELFAWSVSLSHEKHFVVAFAVALKRGIAADPAGVSTAIFPQSVFLESSDLVTLQKVFEGTKAESFGKGNYDERKR